MMGMPAMQEAPPINPKPMNFNIPVTEPDFPTMQPAVGIVTHLHGMKVSHQFDGWPLEPVGYQNNPYNFPSFRKYTYPNDQRAAMLWYHDHAMDNTGPQVHAGLAGLYFIRDGSDQEIFELIGGAGKEIPLVLQDRNIACGYEKMDYWAGIPTDATNQYERPEFLGETLFVNGRATPFHPVGRSVYRLRILNGSNSRTYALALMNPFWWANQSNNTRIWYSDCMRVIGNDGGLLTHSVKLLNGTDYLLIAPAERLDILLDLTSVELDHVDCLRLVNLAIASAKDDRGDPGLEGIFQSDDLSVLKPANNSDISLNNALTLGQANIMQFCIGQAPACPSLNSVALDAVLANYADDDNFVVNAGVLGTKPPLTPVARNRLVLLMNNTGAATVNPLTPWQDVQMWELGETSGSVPTWMLPFEVDTVGANPLPGNPLPSQTYGIYRATFFEDFHYPLVDATGYPPLHAPTFKPKAGTYERWYVTNIGNTQPLAYDVVDMHPFHIHLVNFTVLRRWELDETGAFVPKVANELEFDGISRHDTVRVQANELLELLIYFPPGYTGDYVYHCHLVEHEDMGMMLHFDVQP